MYHIEFLREELLPVSKESNRLLAEFKKDNIDIKECVRQYDE
jgi:hypothetical protein